MQADNILQWLQEATREENLDVANWEKLVALVEAAFWERSLDKACYWKMVVLILKGYVKYFRGIGLVEVLWKATT